MKKNTIRLLAISVAMLFGIGLLPFFNVYAEEETTISTGTNISLTPTTKFLQIASNNTYDSTFAVKNGGETAMKIEVYAAPYSYVYSNEEDLYKLGFTNENNFTQISRWITFQDVNGNYVEKPIFSIEPNSELEISFRVTTPNDIPSGGQYAVIFAHTLSSVNNNGGIRTEASPGMVVYGRSTEGEATVSAEISNLEIEQIGVDGKSTITATAKVKNNGNVDFTANGVLKIDPIIGFSSYETAATGGRTSIIPEAELTVSDSWVDAPGFGLFKATWTVSVGDETETIERVIFRISPLFIIIFIIVLTIIIISVIMGIRKRKERRARLAV